MTLKQILSMTWWPTVALALVKAYPEDRKSLAGFRSVYDKLMNMEPVANSGLTIVIEPVEYKHDRGHFWYDVYGILPDKDDSLALEFRPWREWLGMSVAKGTINFLTPSQIAAHCLHEMTYFGFEEQEVQSKWNDIERDADEVRSGTAELEELDIDALSSPRDIKEMLRWLGRYVCFSSVSKKYFGHVHSGPRSHTGLDLPRLKTLYTFQYDVGVDNNEYRPISFSQLCEIFKTQAQKAGGQKVEASSIMPSGMPIVFLDVDGVLVSDPTTRQAAVAPSSHLSWLLRESGAGLVIIGGWAAYDIDGLMNGPLKEYAWCLKGATPRLSSHSEAIAQWLSTSGGKHPYVILSAASVNDNRAIAVNPKFGLSRNDAHKAIKLFKNKYE